MQVHAEAADPHDPAIAVRSQVLDLLVGDGPIDGEVVLPWITSMPEWPALQIELQADAGGTVHVYGPVPASTHAQPVRIVQSGDGRHSALYREGAQEILVDCGKSGDSLFDAVLVGLELHDVVLRDRLVDALPKDASVLTDAQRLRRQLVGHVGHCPAINPAPMDFLVLTAPMFLQILRARDDLASYCVPEIARMFGVSPASLSTRLYVRTFLPKALGLDLLYSGHRQTAYERLTSSTLQAVDDLRKSGCIPTEYHLLLVAYRTNIAFDTLRRHINAEFGLTPLGLRLLGNQPATPLPWRIPMPFPPQPLVLPIADDMDLDVRPGGTGWTVTLVTTRRPYGTA